MISDAGLGVLFVVGRLRPGVAIDAARDEVSALIARDSTTAFRPGMEAALTPLDEIVFGATRPALVALAVCVGLVLLIGCANVAVLLVVRAATRTHETAVRLAIGATKWRLLRQSFVDAAMLGTIGGIVGVGLAYWTIDVILALAPGDIPRLDTIRVDTRVLAGFALAASASATILDSATASRGIFPARRQTISAAGAKSHFVRSRTVRRTLIIMEISLALVLLVCAGLDAAGAS